MAFMMNKLAMINSCGQEKEMWNKERRIRAGNTNRRERLSTVDLFSKVACFVEK